MTGNLNWSNWPLDYRSQDYAVDLDGERVIAYQTAWSFYDTRERTIVWAFEGGLLDGRRAAASIDEAGRSFKGWITALVAAAREESDGTTASDPGGSRTAPA